MAAPPRHGLSWLSVPFTCMAGSKPGRVTLKWRVSQALSVSEQEQAGSRYTEDTKKKLICLFPTRTLLAFRSSYVYGLFDTPGIENRHSRRVPRPHTEPRPDSGPSVPRWAASPLCRAFASHTEPRPDSGPSVPRWAASPHRHKNNAYTLCKHSVRVVSMSAWLSFYQILTASILDFVLPPCGRSTRGRTGAGARPSCS